jgi:hypothetical protein
MYFDFRKNDVLFYLYSTDLKLSEIGGAFWYSFRRLWDCLICLGCADAAGGKSIFQWHVSYDVDC